MGLDWAVICSPAAAADPRFGSAAPQTLLSSPQPVLSQSSASPQPPVRSPGAVVPPVAGSKMQNLASALRRAHTPLLFARPPFLSFIPIFRAQQGHERLGRTRDNGLGGLAGGSAWWWRAMTSFGSFSVNCILPDKDIRIPFGRKQARLAARNERSSYASGERLHVS